MVKIYQIDIEKDTEHVKFMPFDFVRLRKKFDFSIYKEVWSGELEDCRLDKIFRIFNLEHPEDFKGHSLSVSDIVQIIDSDEEPNGYYYCDSIGWKKIDIVQM